MTLPHAREEDSRSTMILVLDDDNLVRNACARALREDGFEVLEATSGWEAIELTEERRGAIDLLLSDVMLPDLSVSELVSRVMAIQPRLRVLLISGYGAADLAERGLDLGHLPLLQKPFGVGELVRTVRELLPGDRGRPRSPPPP
ncbi:MAG TPA: response regulator [Gemmatimonadales bacterium]|nr:response regulator [Gemmatimonadales bacterium]